MGENLCPNPPGGTGRAGVAVGALVAIGAGVAVGALVAIGAGVAVGALVAIGAGVAVGALVAIGAGVAIGALVAIGARSGVASDDDTPETVDQDRRRRPIRPGSIENDRISHGASAETQEQDHQCHQLGRTQPHQEQASAV
jgi:carbonic anhydrase/acetyltransferase-like protein (isoleucine patch superfamily)